MSNEVTATASVDGLDEPLDAIGEVGEDLVEQAYERLTAMRPPTAKRKNTPNGKSGKTTFANTAGYLYL